jgi:hypothetical protein
LTWAKASFPACSSLSRYRRIHITRLVTRWKSRRQTKRMFQLLQSEAAGQLCPFAVIYSQKLSEMAATGQPTTLLHDPTLPTEDTNEYIVGQRRRASERDGIVAEDVPHDTVLCMWRDVRGEKGPEELCQGAPRWPVTDGIEDDFAAAIRVLLPARELVGTCQADTFLEPVVAVRGPAQGPALHSVGLDTACEQHGDVRVTGDAKKSGNLPRRATPTCESLRQAAPCLCCAVTHQIRATPSYGSASAHSCKARQRKKLQASGVGSAWTFVHSAYALCPTNGAPRT